MSLPRTILTCVTALGLVAYAWADPCPKVNTTTQTPATMRAIVKSINCLVDASSGQSTSPSAVRVTESRDGAHVDTLPIIGPQHSRAYPGLVLAILSMPVDNTQKAVLVTPDSPQAFIRGTSGGECKLRLNPDRTLEAQCSQAGGTVFVVYR